MLLVREGSSSTDKLVSIAIGVSHFGHGINFPRSESINGEITRQLGHSIDILVGCLFDMT